MRLRRRRSVTVSSLSCICVFTFSIVSLGSTCKLMVFPVKSAQRFSFHHKDEGPNAESISLLDIVIRTGLSILELLSRKDQTLLVCISFSMRHNHIFVSDLHESSIRRNLIRRDSFEGGLSRADLGVGGEEIALHVSCGVPLHTSCWNSMVPVSC